MPPSAGRLSVLVTECSGLIGSAVAERLAPDYNFSGAPSEKYDTITVQGTERLIRRQARGPRMSPRA